MSGWGWDDVRPYFERSERRVDAAGHALDGRSARRQGRDAVPAPDARATGSTRRPSWACRVTDDFNGPHPEGFGCYQVTIRDGRAPLGRRRFPAPRIDAARNVRLETGAWVSKIRFDRRRAIGRGICSAAATPRFAAADREVILCGGAVNSPQLLQLSGHRPGGDACAQRGITPLLDNPAVGGHLAGSPGRGVLLQGDAADAER